MIRRSRKAGRNGGFLNELAPILKKKGWWGKKEVTNPDTGEVRHVRQGSPSRLKLIYRQNTQSAYMAGRYKQQLENADSAPYLCYIAVLDQKTRPAHAALHNMVFRYDDPFWGAMYRPTAGIAVAASPPIQNPV